MERTLCSGVDGSSESLAAARWAAEEAVLRDARLHLIHAGAQARKSRGRQASSRGAAPGRFWITPRNR